MNDERCMINGKGTSIERSSVLSRDERRSKEQAVWADEAFCAAHYSALLIPSKNQ